MFCINCGAELEEGVKFCPNCGQQVGNNVQIQQPQAVYIVQNHRYPKFQFVALISCLFLGLLGIHDFYLGRNICGLAKLLITLLLGGIGIGILITGLWCLGDFIMILAKQYDSLLTDEEIQRRDKGNKKDMEEYEKLKKERAILENEEG